MYIYTKFKHTEAIVKILMLTAENSYTQAHTHTHTHETWEVRKDVKVG